MDKPTSEVVKLTKARDDVIEQATEAAMYGSGHDELDAAVYRYFIACGDDELAADMLARNLAFATSPAGRAALASQPHGAGHE